MICDHAGCERTATVACRFGDGTWTHNGGRKRQTFVRYCDTDYRAVAAMFHLCNVRLIPHQKCEVTRP